MIDLKTVIIFGVSSFVGSNLAEFFKDEHKVIGTYFNTPIDIPGMLTVPCDVLNKDEVQTVMFAFKPDVAIYCVGMSSVELCAEHEKVADALNTAGLFNVSEFCQRYKAQICFFSSSYVFGGEDKDYLEMDIPDASSIYGKTKASAEFFIQKTSLNYIIFRCCTLYGRSINPDRVTWFEKIQQELKKGKSFVSDDYLKVGFLDVMYLGMIIQICWDRDATNRLYQVSTSDVMSYYEFVKQYGEIFEEQNSLAIKGRWSFPEMSSRTSNITGGVRNYRMNTANIENYLNIQLPSIKESMQYTKRRLAGDDELAKKKTNSEEISFI